MALSKEFFTQNKKTLAIRTAKQIIRAVAVGEFARFAACWMWQLRPGYKLCLNFPNFVSPGPYMPGELRWGTGRSTTAVAIVPALTFCRSKNPIIIALMSQLI